MLTSLSRASLTHDRQTFEAVIYVGDGIWDARACRALGWPFMGIAQAPTKIERLRSEGAQVVLPNFEQADVFLHSIGCGR